MPLTPGTKIVRLTPSSTARNLKVGDVAVIGGLQPTAHHNLSSYGGENYFPVQDMVSGLWSNLETGLKDIQWKYLSPLDDPDYFEEEEIPEEDQQESLDDLDDNIV